MLRSAASCLLATKGGGPETLPAFTWRLLASSLLREGFTLQCSPQASGPTGVPRPQSISSPQHIQSLPSSLLDLGPHNGHLSITTHISTHPHLSNSSTGCAPSTIPVHPSDHWGGTLSRGSHRCSNSNSNIYSTAAGPSRTMSTAASTSSIQSSSNTLPASMGTSSSTKPSSTSTSKRSRAPLPILQPPNHITVSAFPPLNRVGPLTVQYPFPVEYHADREIIVRSLARAGIPQGVEQLPGSVFNVPVRLDLLHRVVRWLRAAWQQGTHKAKRRGEVRGGGRKPWPQKGTGRARQGSNRSPLFRKGGVALGPRPRSHAHALPLNIQIQGYKCALSAKANEGRLVLVNSLQPEPVSSLPGMVPGAVVGSSSSSSSSSSAGPNSATTGRGKIVGGLLKGGKGAPVVKTKATLAQLQALLQGTAPYRSALLVDSGPVAADGGEALRKGARNLPWVTIMPWYEITVYDILKHGALVMTTSAASQLTQRLLRPALSPYQACRPVRLEWWRRQQVALGQALSQLRQAAAVQNNHGYQGQRRRRWLTA